MTPEQAEKVRRLAACTMQPGSSPKRFIRQLSGYPADQALTPRQVDWLDKLYHQYRKQLARFGPLPRWWTPGDLLERGELEPGETVDLDIPGRVVVHRLSSMIAPEVRGKYVAWRVIRQDEDRDCTSYLHADGAWHGVATDHVKGRQSRDYYAGYFDSLSELLDALYVATLNDDKCRVSSEVSG